MATSRQRARGKKPEKIEITEEDKNPGVVYVGHIPHGFYEKEMKSYFSQFGDVLAIKLSRSKKTGRSKGYAFVKFRYAAVAKTVAETCNNYLFFNRLLKCSYRPMSEVHSDTFISHPKKPVRKEKAMHNTAKSEESLKNSNKKALLKLKKKMKHLADSGIELDLNEILNLPQDQEKTKTSVERKPTQSQKKSGKSKKRERTDDDSDSNDIGDSESLSVPTPKRRKKMSDSIEKVESESKGKVHVSPTKAKSNEVTVSKKKEVKDSASGKKGGSSKAMKKGKGKVAVPLGIKKSSSGKRKK